MKTYRVLAPKSFLEITEKEVDRALRYDRALSAMMIRIDWPKTLEVGDAKPLIEEIVSSFAELMVKSFRTVDTAGRLSPDEFAILLPETRPAQAEVPALNLYEVLMAHPVDTSAGPRTVAIHVGIAGMSPRMRDANALLAAAQLEVMEAAKDPSTPIRVAIPEKMQMSGPRSGSVH